MVQKQAPRSFEVRNHVVKESRHFGVSSRAVELAGMFVDG